MNKYYLIFIFGFDNKWNIYFPFDWNVLNVEDEYIVFFISCLLNIENLILLIV